MDYRELYLREYRINIQYLYYLTLMCFISMMDSWGNLTWQVIFGVITSLMLIISVVKHINYRWIK